MIEVRVSVVKSIFFSKYANDYTLRNKTGARLRERSERFVFVYWTSGDIVLEFSIFLRFMKTGVGWDRASRISLVFTFSEFLKTFRKGLGLMRVYEHL
jgi:hypothetical protein